MFERHTSTNQDVADCSASAAAVVLTEQQLEIVIGGAANQLVVCRYPATPEDALTKSFHPVLS